MFGEFDFFKKEPADALIAEGTLKDCKTHLIKTVGHHLYFDNPKLTNDTWLPRFFEIEATKN